MTFWQHLAKKKKPFLVLAPMEDVTDTVFRQVIEEIAPPDVFFTEFTNVEAILHGETSRLTYKKTKVPTVAQIWGINPENFYKAAQYITALGFSGIDINMGCPDKDVVKNGCGIALIRDRPKVGEIIQATKEGAGGLPVSIKTRIGWDKIVTEDWCGFLLEQKLDALTVHGRTGKEKSDGPAHWDEIAKIVKMKGGTVIIGNGDVKSASNVQGLADRYGVDGVMIGRGIFENPWCFSDHLPTQKEKLDLLKRHLELWEDTWEGKKNFSVLKKYFKIYIRDFEGAGELRSRLMQTTDAEGARFELAIPLSGMSV